MPKKILMISYFFPPIANVGGLRACGFSKYLPEFGWEPYVISVKNPDRSWCTRGSEIPPPGVRAYYTYALFSNLTYIAGKINGLLYKILKIFLVNLNKPLIQDLFCIPDQFIGWIPLTVLKGYNLVRQEKIDVIYVSCKPFSSAIIGVILKFLTKRPLVLDFRDPISPLVSITEKSFYKYLPSFLITKKIEEIILRYADKLILVANETRKLYLSDFRFLCNKTDVIYNGFEETYFQDDFEPFKKFTMVYVGNFYVGMTPTEPLFMAFYKIVSENPSMKDEISFLYVGTDAQYIDEMAKRYNVSAIVKTIKHVSRVQSVQYIRKASLVLIRNVSPMLTTKLFEALAAGAPILATTYGNEAEDLIRTYSSAIYYIMQPDDTREIVAAINDAYSKWRNGTLKSNKNIKYYSDLNKRALTSKFSAVLDGLLE